MKNVLKTFVTAGVTAVMLILNADAQTAAVDLGQNSAAGSAIFTGGQKDANSLSDIHPRAVKDFQKSFKGITNEDWSRLDDGYIASFTTDSVQTRVAYNLRGNRQYLLRYYSEMKLPGEVRSIVKSVYYDYAILNVAEINFDEQPVYIIYMQDENHLRTIGVYDGEIKEINEYKKG